MWKWKTVCPPATSLAWKSVTPSQPVAALTALREPGGGLEDGRGEGVVEAVDVLDVGLDDDQAVARVGRHDVEEGEGVLVFVDLRDGQLAAHEAAEDAVVHGCLRWCGFCGGWAPGSLRSASARRRLRSFCQLRRRLSAWA
jgi:hypothetical protein